MAQTGQQGSTYVTGCLSSCDTISDVINGSCSGIGCCETSIPRDAYQYNISVTSFNNHSGIWGFNPCGYAFVAEDGFFSFSTDYLDKPRFNKVPIVLDWLIPNEKCDDAKRDTTTYMCRENSNCTDAENGNGYQCHCLEGFQGNPYLQNGCQDIDECVTLQPCNGKCTNLPGTYDCSCPRGYRGDGRRGGKGCTPIIDRSTRVALGQGTVYRGILPNNMVVAIKKAKILDRSQVEEFINELIILSQINHRNVVKLIGCCFETEFPLLVYEFVTNGTLSDHIHNCRHESTLSWRARLRIAGETAGALSYLHYDASTQILHRDIKSTNILLDENYTAKVADFGASRLVPLDRMQLTTLVRGTLGYLDPEYLQSSQLTKKSGVYSFGVVLAELLTGLRALSFERAESERNLSSYFASAIKGERLFEIIDSRVLNEGNPKEIKEVAMLASRCLRVKGEDRPTMKEVAIELEGLMKRPSKCDGILKSNALGNDDSISNQVPFEIESGR
ncbi:hypothetical protein BT93_H3715 [Corymbia citriodora subsp. variegata]|nr:hypothetical protein BT93_H3715 [Corymbia citriodora subsp. variegata]